MRWFSRGGRDNNGAGDNRVEGYPTSSNRASSFHLWWSVPRPEPLSEASVILRVAKPPQVRSLYFWALQVSFLANGSKIGAAHTGLQWHPGAPNGAVNWGGYSDAGGELGGGRSALQPVDGPNTFHFPWSPGTAYRFRIWSPRAGVWRSEVTDMGTGVTTVIRDLQVPATALAEPVVWSEVFARCDDPETEVRWSSFEARTAAGQQMAVHELVLSYQGEKDGGCANTESRVEGKELVQVAGLKSVPRRGARALVLEQ